MFRMIDTADGSIAASYQYDAWGNVEESTGEMAQENSYLFTGREYDWQTGVYYYRARSYDANLGRFLQQDPAGMVDGPNMYLYCGNDPVNGVDPSGRVTSSSNSLYSRCKLAYAECVNRAAIEYSKATGYDQFQTLVVELSVSTIAGATIGAVGGSVVPGLGTVAGAGIGASIGLIAGIVWHVNSFYSETDAEFDENIETCELMYNNCVANIILYYNKPIYTINAGYPI